MCKRSKVESLRTGLGAPKSNVFFAHKSASCGSRTNGIWLQRATPTSPSPLSFKPQTQDPGTTWRCEAARVTHMTMLIHRAGNVVRGSVLPQTSPESCAIFCGNIQPGRANKDQYISNSKSRFPDSVMFEPEFRQASRLHCLDLLNACVSA